MPTLTDLTQFVTFHSAAAQEQLWEWFSAQVYALILTAEQDSLLVRVRQRFSLAPVVAACAGYRRYAGGVGQAADYPVVRLCWALLVRRLQGWSLRDMEHELRVNLLVRWCTHFALQEQTPDHTTLWRFEDWVRQHALDVLFVAVLEQIDEDFPDAAHARQCGDTFGVRANVADVSLHTLLRQGCRRLLLALERALPQAYAACVAQVDMAALFGADDEPPEYHLPPAAKDARTLVTAQAAAACLAVVQTAVPAITTAAPPPPLAKLQDWCAIIAKILADEFTDQPLPPPKTPKAPTAPKAAKARKRTAATTAAAAAAVAAIEVAAVEVAATAVAAKEVAAIEVAATEMAATEMAATAVAPPDAFLADTAAVPPTPAPPAAPPAPTTGLRRCTEEERGAYRRISVTDPDATVRQHGKSITLGYNVAVLASRNFVRGIRAYTGATPDGATTAPSLTQHQAQFAFVPDQLVYDRAAGTHKHIVDVRCATAGQTQLIARQIDHRQRSTRFTVGDFTLTPEGMVCPNGVCTTRGYRAGGATGDHYRFLASQCRGCPLWDQCREPGSSPKGHRTVFHSDHTLVVQVELAFLATPAAKTAFAFRANIERHIAALTLHNGARRAKVRGLPKVNCQVTLAATAYNLKRWHVLTLEQERARTKDKPPCPTGIYPPT